MCYCELLSAYAKYQVGKQIGHFLGSLFVAAVCCLLKVVSVSQTEGVAFQPVTFVTARKQVEARRYNEEGRRWKVQVYKKEEEEKEKTKKKKKKNHEEEEEEEEEEGEEEEKERRRRSSKQTRKRRRRSRGNEKQKIGRRRSRRTNKNKC